jgi:hypothetical protein
LDAGGGRVSTAGRCGPGQCVADPRRGRGPNTLAPAERAGCVAAHLQATNVKSDRRWFEAFCSGDMPPKLVGVRGRGDGSRRQGAVAGRSHAARSSRWRLPQSHPLQSQGALQKAGAPQLPRAVWWVRGRRKGTGERAHGALRSAAARTAPLRAALPQALPATTSYLSEGTYMPPRARTALRWAPGRILGAKERFSACPSMTFTKSLVHSPCTALQEAFGVHTEWCRL